MFETDQEKVRVTQYSVYRSRETVVTNLELGIIVTCCDPNKRTSTPDSTITGLPSTFTLRIFNISMAQIAEVLPLEHVPGPYSEGNPLYWLRVYIPLDDVRKRVPNLPAKSFQAYKNAMFHYTTLYRKNEKLGCV